MGAAAVSYTHLDVYKRQSQNSYAPALLRSLKKLGYRIYILSNYGKTFFEDRLSCFEFLNYVDGRVVSYEVHSVKPEPGIYEALLERYKICLLYTSRRWRSFLSR